MHKYIKYILIAIGSIGLLILIFVSVCLIDIFIIMPNKVETEKLISQDKKIQMIITFSKDNPNSFRSAKIQINDNISGKAMYKCEDTYRTFDLNGIYFGNNTYDIWVDSSDVGIYCYQYYNGVWMKKKALMTQTVGDQTEYFLHREGQINQEKISQFIIPAPIIQSMNEIESELNGQ